MLLTTKGIFERSEIKLMHKPEGERLSLALVKLPIVNYHYFKEPSTVRIKSSTGLFSVI